MGRIDFNDKAEHYESSDIFARDSILLETYLAGKSTSTKQNAREKLHGMIYKYHIFAPSEAGLDSLLEQLIARGAPKSTQAAYAVMCQHWAAAKGMPALRSREIVPTRKKYPPYSAAEVQAMITGAKNARERAIIATLAMCGLRKKELQHLYLIDIDEKYEFLSVKDHDNAGIKSHQEREIPIPAQLKPYLKAWISRRNTALVSAAMDSKYLFVTQNGGMLGDDLVYQIIDASCKKLGIRFSRSENGRYGKVHSFRRFYLSSLGKDDETNLEMARQFAGHSTVEMTSHYMTFDREDKLKAIKKIKFF
jgi:integrase